jgi:translocation and assembly module TamB
MASGKTSDRKPQPDSARKPAKRAGRKWLRWLGISLAALLVFLILVVALVPTGPVLRALTPTLNQAVSTAIDGRFALGRIEGSLWTGLSLDQLMIDMPDTGLQVDGQKIDFDWSPRKLLGGTLQVDQITASRLSVTLPDKSASTPQAEDETSQSGGLSLPVAVRLGKLDIAEIHIVNPADGRVFTYHLDASARAQQSLSAHLDLALVPLDNSIDRLNALIDFDPADKRLKADIKGKLDRAGVVMTLAGLAPSEASNIDLSLAGDGPADHWKGKLAFSASDLAELSGDLGLGLKGDTLQFDLDGTTKTLGDLAKKLPAQVRGDIGLVLAGAFDLAGNQISVSTLEAHKPGLVDVSGTAKVDLAQSRLNANVDASVDGAASTLIDDQIRWHGLKVSAHADGDLALPDVTAKIEANGVVTPVSKIDNLTGDAKLASQGDSLDLIADINTRGQAFDDADLTAMTGPDQNLKVQVSTTQNFDRFHIANLTLKTAKLNLSGEGNVDAKGNVSNASLTGDVDDLSAFAAISGLDLKGQGKVQVSDAAWSIQNGGAADIAITGDNAGFGVPELNHIVGPSPKVNGHVTLGPNMDLVVDLPDIQTAKVAGKGNVNISNNFSEMSVSSDLKLDRDIVPPGVPVSLTGDGHLRAKLSGPIAQPAGPIEVSVPGLSTQGEKFANLNLTSTLKWAGTGGQSANDKAGNTALAIENRLSFGWRKKPYHLSADLALPSDAMRIRDIALKGDGIDITGDLALPDYATPLRGQITLSKLRAALLSDFGVPTSNGEMSAKFDFVPDGTSQTLKLSAKADGVRLVDATNGAQVAQLQSVNVSGDITRAFAAPAFDLTLNGKDIAASDGEVKTLTATVQGDLKSLRANVDAQGQVKGTVPVKLASATKVKLDRGIEVEADKFDLDIGDQKIRLSKPATYRQTKAGRQTADLAMTVGKGTVNASVDLVPSKVFDATSAIKNVDLGPWGAMFDAAGFVGTLNLDADLHQKAGQASRGKLDGEIGGIKVASAEQLPPMALKLSGVLKDRVLNANLDVGRTDMKVATATAKVPFEVSVLTGKVAPLTGEPVSASANMDTEIGDFWPYVPLPDHSVSGKVKLDAKLSGTLDDPDWRGNITLRDGRYEHLRFGTLLRDIRFDGKFGSSGIKITGLSADDGGNGTVKGKADVDFSAENGGPAYDAELTLRDVAVTRMDELRLWTDVDLNVTGDIHHADIKSTTTLRRGEVDLNVALPASVPELDVQNLPGANADKQDKKKKEKAFKANLDVKINMPARLFVRGKGLDSEWGGNLAITGTADNPKIVGQIKALRGQMDVIGKTFVVKDSKITFSGAQPPNPILDIEGVYTTDDLTVTAAFSGPASDAKLTLSSDPSMPQDEILSHVLFGKSKGGLTPVEAVQLANAASQLSGGKGLDVIGSIRNMLGVDVFRVDSGENGPSVKVGKYIADGVYVGTKQGATSGSSGVEVEIDVAPHVKVTSETSQIDSKAGIQFKLDY